MQVRQTCLFEVGSAAGLKYTDDAGSIVRMWSGPPARGEPYASHLPCMSAGRISFPMKRVQT